MNRVAWDEPLWDSGPIGVKTGCRSLRAILVALSADDEAHFQVVICNGTNVKSLCQDISQDIHARLMHPLTASTSSKSSASLLPPPTNVPRPLPSLFCRTLLMLFFRPCFYWSINRCK